MWWPALLALLVPAALARRRPEPELDAQWELWKKTYRKQYNGEVGPRPAAGGWRPARCPRRRPHGGGGG